VVFKRRDRRSPFQIAWEFIYPRGGWTRAFHYVKHRIRRLPDSPERIARGVGVAQASLDEAVRYAQIRKSFGKPICEHQAIQIKLADMATQVESARLLIERAAAAFDRGERCDMEAGMAKLAGSEAAIFCSLESMRVHGGYGYSTEFNVERFYRDAPLLAIGEGTNELQRILIARQLIARNPV